jgi:hypothetical protein
VPRTGRTQVCRTRRPCGYRPVGADLGGGYRARAKRKRRGDHHEADCLVEDDRFYGSKVNAPMSRGGPNSAPPSPIRSQSTPISAPPAKASRALRYATAEGVIISLLFLQVQHLAHSRTGRCGQDVGRAASLQSFAGIEHAQTVRESRSLVQVVRDQDDRDAQGGAQCGQLVLQMPSRATVHGRERFIEQQHGRVTGERSCNGHSSAWCTDRLVGIEELRACLSGPVWLIPI